MSENNNIGEENVFLPNVFRSPKPNTPSFPRGCVLVGYERLLVPNPDGSNTPYAQKPCAQEEIIFPYKIDAGLYFPYSVALVKLCQHFQIALTQLSLYAIRSWAGFKIMWFQ